MYASYVIMDDTSLSYPKNPPYHLGFEYPFSKSEIDRENKLYGIVRKIFHQMVFDIENYEIDIHFNPKESYLSGKAKIYVKPNVQNLDGIKLKFNPSLEILRINDEDGHELFFSRDRLRKFLYIYFHNSIEIPRWICMEIRRYNHVG